MLLLAQVPATLFADTPSPTVMLDVDRYDPTFRLDPPPPEQSHHTPHCQRPAATTNMGSHKTRQPCTTHAHTLTRHGVHTRTPTVLGAAGTQGKYGVGTVAPLMISVDTDA